MANAPVFELTSSRQFPEWLVEQKLSLAFTTYQAGKLFFLGTKPDSKLSVFERTFNRCLGLWSNGQTLWLSSLYQLWRFENVLEQVQRAETADRLYVPQVGYVTGDLDIHDVAVEASGRVVFALFGCLATIIETHSFVPLWKPRLSIDWRRKIAAISTGLLWKTERPDMRPPAAAATWPMAGVSGGTTVVA